MVRLTYDLDMTLAVDWDIKLQTKQNMNVIYRSDYLFLSYT